jgi:hypothetical protein
MARCEMDAPTRRSATPGNDAGMSLIVTIFGIVLLTVLGFGLTGLGMRATTSTIDERNTAEALAIADAGIAHAKKLILWTEWASLNQFLQNVGGTACDGDELAAAPIAPLPPGYPTTAADFIPAAGRPFGRGQYQVFVCDDHPTDVDLTTGILDVNPNADVNKRILIRAVGTGPGGSTATVEQIIGAQDLPAVVVNGPLVVSGSPIVTGAGGAIHSNGTLAISGGPCVSQYFSSSTTVPVSGSSAGTGATCSNVDMDIRPDSAPLTVPILDYNMFKAQADYWLESGGQVTNPATGLPIPGGLPGWNYSANRWRMMTNIPPGTYWVDTSVVVVGSPGSPASPLPLTILARYAIDIGGNPTTVPDLIVTGPGMTTPTGISMLAGTDLEINGALSQTFTGLYYAQHQLDITGTPVFNGQVLAANVADTNYPPGSNNLVPLDNQGRMEIAGNPTINFNGSGIVGTRALSWRECRDGMNPANPCGALWGGNP